MPPFRSVANHCRRLPSLLAVLLLLGLHALACVSETASTPLPSPDAILAETADNIRSVQSLQFLITHDPGSVYVSRLNARVTDADGVWSSTGDASVTIDALLVSGPDAAPETGVFIQLQSILLPDAYFVTDPLSGAWLKPPLDDLPVSIPITELANVLGDMVSSVTEAQLIGQERLDGLNTYQIAGRAPASVMEWLLLTPSEGQSVQVVIWTDRELKLLRRARIIGPVDQHDSPDTVREIKLTGFNEPVTITAPDNFIDLTTRQ